MPEKQTGSQSHNVKQRITKLINLAAGGIPGVVARTITAPLEKVKLSLQNQDSNPRILSGEMKRYTGMGNCFTRHITELGATSLWRGNVVGCVLKMPTAAFSLMFKDTLKNLFPKTDKNKEFAKFATVQIASGALAGGLTNTLVYPLIYVRTVLGADLGKVKKYTWMGDCLAKTVKEGGVLSLYNGIGPSTIGLVVYRGVQFGLHDTIKAFNPYQKEFSVKAVWSKFIVAQIAVSVSGFIAYPFDTLQRRLQIEASKPKAEQMYDGMSDCFSKILKAEGPKGFFKGAAANILCGIGAVIVLVIYDEIINALDL